jgi:hypothetical protein
MAPSSSRAENPNQKSRSAMVTEAIKTKVAPEEYVRSLLTDKISSKKKSAGPTSYA